MRTAGAHGGGIGGAVEVLGDGDILGRIVEVAADEDVCRGVAVVDRVGGAVKFVGIVGSAFVVTFLESRRPVRRHDDQVVTINNDMPLDDAKAVAVSAGAIARHGKASEDRGSNVPAGGDFFHE